MSLKRKKGMPMKAELGQRQLGLMRWSFYETCPRAVSITRPSPSVLPLDHGRPLFKRNEMKCRCFRPLFCTMKAELGRVQLGLMRWNFYKTCPRAVSNLRPYTLSPARYRQTTVAPQAELRVERSILIWDKFYLISPSCPKANSALMVKKKWPKTPALRISIVNHYGFTAMKYCTVPSVTFFHMYILSLIMG